MSEDIKQAYPKQEHVLPKQVCECWQRRRIMPVDIQECWYCRYADFGWQKDIADEVGICRYPESQV